MKSIEMESTHLPLHLVKATNLVMLMMMIMMIMIMMSFSTVEGINSPIIILNSHIDNLIDILPDFDNEDILEVYHLRSARYIYNDIYMYIYILEIVLLSPLSLLLLL